MKVKILVDGPYAKQMNKNKVGAVELVAGQVVEFADDYAKYLIEQKLAEKAGPLAKTEAGIETVFTQDLTSDKSLVEQVEENVAKGAKGRRP